VHQRSKIRVKNVTRDRPLVKKAMRGTNKIRKGKRAEGKKGGKEQQKKEF